MRSSCRQDFPGDGTALSSTCHLLERVLVVTPHEYIGLQRALFSGSGSVVTHLPMDVMSPREYLTGYLHHSGPLASKTYKDFH